MMAIIDKIYGTKIERDVFQEWCKIYCPKSVKYFYDWDNSWNPSEVHPITNFPITVDRWMLKNCPIDYVLERIRDQYDIQIGETI